MITMLQFTPPDSYVKSTQAWRLGRIAVAIILAGLSIAGGMALPHAPATAYDGYTYTERICQEYGQQPRYYQVRDPIPGSDWRNDGGWAIILERGSNVSPPVYSFGALTSGNGIGQGPYAWEALAFSNTQNSGINQQFNRWNNALGGIPSGTYITAQDGRAGWVIGNNDLLIIDRVKDGAITLADIFLSGPNYYWERSRYSIVSAGSNYGGQYIRWANLQWCR